jgi:Plasmid pRiA4b ORF-3-like protein
MTAASIARLRIKLDDVEPAVVRRVEVPLTIRLDRLHLVLQAAMGWMNSHLYEIRARDVGWGRPDPHFGDGPLDASKARLTDVLEDVGTRSLKYLYDFGDGWEHSIHIERITDAIPGMAYPCLIDAAGRCPPEDVGAPGDTTSSSMQLLIRTTRNMPRGSSGSAATLIPTTSMLRHSLRPCTASQKSGAASHRPVSGPDPGSSADGYAIQARRSLEGGPREAFPALRR